VKKTFITITCLCSLFLVACASKDLPQDTNTFEAPETENPAPETDETNSQETQDTSEENQTEEDEDVDLINDEIPLEQELPEPEELEEPVVITLDYTEEEEATESSEETAEQTEESLEEEVEPENIPEISTESEENPQVTEEKPEEATEEASEENPKSQESADDDVIDIEEDSDNDDVISLDDEEENTSEEESPKVEEEIIPSRKVTMKKMEYVDITYPGNGWIYMGITDGSKDLSYFGRKLGTENTKFTLQARNAGKKIVHFYKNDTLSGQYIDDYIEIEILPQKGSNKTHIEAPAYKQPVPKKAKELIKKTENQAEVKTENTAEETNSTDNEVKTNPVSQDKKSTVENKSNSESEIKTENIAENTNTQTDTPASTIDTDTLLQEAQVLYNEKEYKRALERINTFFEYATSKRDLGLYLKGQILEAKSDIQDIKAAIDSYTTLTKNYPASKRWDDANKRIIYLKRFYLEVR